MEERVAGLESEIQGQRKEINRFVDRLNRPGLLLEQAAQSVQKDSDSLIFRANLGNRKLFGRIAEPKC